MTSEAVQTAAPRASLDIGKVLGLTFATIGRNWSTFLILVVPLVVIPAAVNGYFLTQLVTPGSTTFDTSRILKSLGLIVALSVPVSLVLQPLFSSCISWTVWADEAGSRPDTWTALRAAGSQFGWIILAAFLRGVLVLLGSMLLIVPGIIAWVGLCLTMPACVVEKRNASDAMSRSWDLTRGQRMQVFLTFLVLVIVAWIPALVLTSVGALAAFIMPGVGAILRASLNAVAGGVSTLLIGAGIGCVYVELRTLKEGAGAMDVAQVFA